MPEPFDPRPLLSLPAAAQQDLVARLASFVTPARLARLETVLAARTRHLTVVFEDVYHPHNASAVLRTCECLGVQDVHIVEGQKRFRPNVEVVHGAARWLTLHRWRKPEGHDIRSCLATLRERGYRVVATSPREDALPLGEVPLERPLAVCFGTEETGLSHDVLSAADICAQIPMPGFTRSLNVSVTAALVLYDLTTRLRAQALPWPLDEVQRDQLRLLWLADDGKGARELARAALAAAGLLPPPPPFFADLPR
jgi:tRNA (guanosine-2'-O-)-methyltransferase